MYGFGPRRVCLALTTALWLTSALRQVQVAAAASLDVSGAVPRWHDEDCKATGAVHLLQREAVHRVEQTRRGSHGDLARELVQAEQRLRRYSPGVAKYVVDLDLPPQDRFRKICRSLAEESLRRGNTTGGGSDDDVIKLWFDTWVPPEERREWTELVRRSIPIEYLEELQGMEDEYRAVSDEHGGAKLHFMHTVDEMLLLTAIYDVNYPMPRGYPETGDDNPKYAPYPDSSTGCSGILVATPNGTVLHGRNMDWAMYGSLNSGHFNEVTFKRGGQDLFVSIIFGYVPSVATTGMRLGSWSISQNLHHANKRRLNLLNAKAGGRNTLWELRRLLETAPDFETAVKELEQTRWTAPQYFVIAGAGPNEGAIVTAHRSKNNESSEAGYPAPLMFTRRLQPQAGTWYLAQTNDEAWARPDDRRRVTEQAWMDQLGREGVNKDSLMRLLRTPPALQFNTLFSWVASSATNYSSLDTQNPADPEEISKP